MHPKRFVRAVGASAFFRPSWPPDAVLHDVLLAGTPEHKRHFDVHWLTLEAYD